MSLIVGSRLGPYELIASLGAGGMGEVYRARDAQLDRDVAIKVLPAAFVADAERVARFQREARTLASLSHPNIAIVHGLEQADSTHALVMELVEGEDLSQRIARGPVPLDEALTIARQIAAALEAAHEQGIVHRDLKPANIRIRPDGTVKVLDFGLAKALTPEGAGGVSATAGSMSPTITSPAMTQVGVILGTAAYMAPEQARGKVVDKRADIWAFGVVLYEMLTGGRPFKGDDIGEVLASVIKESPALDSLPARVRPLLDRCLEKDPRKRLRDIGDIDLLLTASDSQKSVTGYGLWWLGWVAAAIFAVGGAIAVWAPWRTGTPPPQVVRFQAPFPDDVTGAQGFALSPDGRSIAADAFGSDGIRRIWIRSADSLEWRALAGTERGSNPFWSPDGRFLGFLGNEGNGEAKLKRIAVSGGDPQVICDVVVGAGIAQTAASWGRGGVILFSSGTSVGAGARTVVWRVSSTGGTPSPVTALHGSNPNEDHRSPLFLPDGDHFLYLAAGDRGRGVYLGSLREAPDRQPTDPWLSLEQWSGRVVGSGNVASTISPDGKIGYVLFMPEDTLMAQPFDGKTLEVRGEAFPVVDQVVRLGAGVGVFTASSNGALAYRSGTEDRQMTFFNRKGDSESSPGPAGANLDLSADGKRAIADWRSELWLWDFTAEGKRMRFTTDSEQGGNGVWSRDGTRIAYTRGPGVYVKPAPGGKEEALLNSTSPGDKIANDWSPGDRFLLYSAYDPVTQWDLWVLPLTGERKPVRIAGTSGNEVRGQFSPDGRWIAYSSDQSGTREVYLRDFSETNPETGKAVSVSLNNGDQPRWRGDGSELYYRGRGRGGAAGGESRPAGSPSGRGRGGIPIVVLSFKKDGSLATEAPQVLFSPRAGPGPGNGSNAYYDVTADGQHFLINTFAEGNLTAPLTVVLNWAASVKR